MEENFFERTVGIKEDIKREFEENLRFTKDERVRRILQQRKDTSSFIKGISSYLIHNGLEGPLSKKRNLELAANLELYSTALVVLDNIVDGHTERNNQTTYLEEYGVGLNVVAMQYATNISLFNISKYISDATKFTGNIGQRAIGKAIDGMVSMDLDKPKNPKSIKKAIAKVNGITLAAPLALTASIAIKNPSKIWNIFSYGYYTGLAFGLYEEIRDFRGEHGREEGSEILSGRTPYFLSITTLKDSSILDIDPKSNFKDLVYKIENSEALNETRDLIHDQLDRGSKKLERVIRKKEFDILDSLRDDVKKSLVELV